MGVLLPYTGHDLNRGEEGKLTIIVRVHGAQSEAWLGYRTLPVAA